MAHFAGRPSIRGVTFARPRIDRDAGLALVVMLWVSAGVWLDMDASLARQRMIGVATWAILFALLMRERSLVRAQVLTAVAIATAGEVFFSLGIQLYTYRLENLPSFVPPGHGIVYLAAVALGRSQVFAAHPHVAVRVALVGSLGWAIWGVTFSPRSDAFGAVLALCLAGFLVGGRARAVYAGAFVVTSWLEIVGTSAGTWAWAARDPSGLFTVGNPPSGIAGGYCLLDCAALSLGTRLVHDHDRAWWRRAVRLPFPTASVARARARALASG